MTNLSKEDSEIVADRKEARKKFNKIFGDNLGFIRSNKNLTQGVLAEKAGVSTTIISDYENKRKTASAFYAKKIADALEISVDKLCGESETTRYIKKLEDNPIQALLTVIRLFRFHIQLTDEGKILLSMPDDCEGYSATEIRKFFKEYMVMQDFKQKNDNESGDEMTEKLIEYIAEKYKHIPDFPEYKFKSAD